MIQILEPTPAQISQVTAQNRPPSPGQLAKVPRHSVRVTGLVITENEFPAGNGARYDLFPTRAYAAAYDAHTQVLTFYDVKLRHGAADQAAFDSQLRPLGSLGADDLDNAAGPDLLGAGARRPRPVRSRRAGPLHQPVPILPGRAESANRADQLR